MRYVENMADQNDAQPTDGPTSPSPANRDLPVSFERVHVHVWAVFDHLRAYQDRPPEPDANQPLGETGQR